VCLEITSNELSLTTMIFARHGLPFGADRINQVARRHGLAQIDAYRKSAAPAIQELMARSGFELDLESWWKDFELRSKRDLDLSRTNALLDSIMHVPTPNLMATVEAASEELARNVKELIRTVQEMTRKVTARPITASQGSFVCAEAHF
jgi:hypothetical protein